MGGKAVPGRSNWWCRAEAPSFSEGSTIGLDGGVFGGGWIGGCVCKREREQKGKKERKKERECV